VRSLPEFRAAAAAKDIKLMTGMFGFTAKTAEKIVDALKHKLPAVPAAEAKGPEGETYSRAAGALAGLGFKSSEVRSALDEVRREGGAATAEEMVRKALRKLSGGL
jgi:Holliday junction DNA helicase RuvA